jgi:hypothetical protein
MSRPLDSRPVQDMPVGTFLFSALIATIALIWYFWSKKEWSSIDSSGQRRQNNGLTTSVDDPHEPGEDESSSHQDSGLQSSPSLSAVATAGSQTSAETAPSPRSDPPSTVLTSFKQIVSAVTMYVKSDLPY